MATNRRVPPGRAGAAKPVSSGYRGAEGLRKMQEEEAASAARREANHMNANMPFRFYIPAGETREVVIIDDAPDFFRYEHNLKDRRTNKWSIFTACLNEDANCPVCKEAERPAYFAMYLTVIDLTPYESEKHGTIEWSKKLFVVKSAQQKKITRLYERHGTLRGMRLSLTRDGEKDAAIGNDIEFIDFLSEDELAEYVTEYEYERNNKREVKEIVGGEVFDYDELFPLPTEQQLRAIVGGRPEPGARDADDGDAPRSRGRGSDWEDSPRRSATTSRPPAGRPATRPAPRSAEPEDDPVDEVEEEAPRRPTRPASPARPAARTAARPVDDEPEERQRPPSRGTLRGTPARPAAREEEEEAPSATSLADRRRALRR